MTLLLLHCLLFQTNIIHTTANIPSQCQSLQSFQFQFNGLRNYFMYLPKIICNSQSLTNFVTDHTDWNQFNTQPFNPTTDQITLPIVTLFPGLRETGALHLSRWQWITESEQYGFIILIFEGGIDGNEISFNAQSCCGYNRDNNINDVGFIHSLLQTIITSLQMNFKFLQLSLDKIIIYSSGHSNGAFMVDQLSWIQAAYINNYNIPFTASIAISGYIYNNQLLDTSFSGTFTDVINIKKSYPIFYIFSEMDSVIDINGCGCDNINCCCSIGNNIQCISLENAYNRWLKWNNCDSTASFSSNKQIISGSNNEYKQCLFGSPDVIGCDVVTSMCILQNADHNIYDDINVDFIDLKHDMTMFLLEASCLKQNGVWNNVLNSCECDGSVSNIDEIYYCLSNVNVPSMSPSMSPKDKNICCDCLNVSYDANGSNECQQDEMCLRTICEIGDERFFFNPDVFCCVHAWDNICVDEAEIICNDLISL
eukprot:116244_1